MDIGYAYLLDSSIIHVKTSEKHEPEAIYRIRMFVCS